jgi:secreted PhoX family phosphatase
MRWRTAGSMSDKLGLSQQSAKTIGPCFTPDQETLFVAVQHPGTDGSDRTNAATRVPNFRFGGIPAVFFECLWGSHLPRLVTCTG